MASSPISPWKVNGETMETVIDFILEGSKITADGDCSHEIKRCLLLGRKAVTNLDSILKGRDITLPTKVCIVIAMVFPVVMNGFESWAINKHLQFSSVKSLSHVFVTLWTAARQASLSITNSQSLFKLMSLSQWCRPTISSSVVPFSSHFKSFPSLGSFPFPVSWLFPWGGWSIGASASASVFPMNIQGWLSLGLTDLFSLQTKALSWVFFSTTVQKHQFFGTQLSLDSNSHIHTRLLEKPWLWLDGPLLAK